MPKIPSSRKRRSISRSGDASGVPAVDVTDADADADASPSSNASSSVRDSSSSKMTSSRLMHCMVELLCHEIIFMTSLSSSPSLSLSLSSSSEIQMDEIVERTDSANSNGAPKIIAQQTSECNKVIWKRRMYKIEKEFDRMWKQFIEGSACESGAKIHCRDRDGAITGTGMGSGRLYCYHSIIQFLKFIYRHYYKNCLGDGTKNENEHNRDSDSEVDEERCNWDELSRRLTELKSIIMDPNSRLIEALSTHQFESTNDDEEVKDAEEKNGNDDQVATIGAGTMSVAEKKDYESKLKIHEKKFQLIQLKLSIQYCLTLLYQKGEEDYNGVGKDVSKDAQRFYECINDGRFEDHPQTYNLMSSFITSVVSRRTASKHKNKETKTLRKSRKDIKDIVENNGNWLDWRVVLHDIEILVQDWCRTCVPTPEFCPELYIHHSKLQLQNQMKIGEKRERQMNVNHRCYNFYNDSTHTKRTALAMGKEEKIGRSGRHSPGKNDELVEEFEVGVNDTAAGNNVLRAQDEDRRQSSRKEIESHHTNKENRKNKSATTNVMGEVNNLKKKRRRLKNNAKDPLPDILAQASIATGEHNIIPEDSNTKGANSCDIDMNDFHSATSSLRGASPNSRDEEKNPVGVTQAIVIVDDSDSTTDDDEKVSMSNKKLSNSCNDNKKSSKEKRAKSSRKMDKYNRIPSIYEKKKSAISLKFTESSQSQTDDDLAISAPTRKKRQMYTEEEKNAIKKGHKKFGNSWSIIQRSYPVLKDRTQGGIKDCFRNMKKRGEV